MKLAKLLFSLLFLLATPSAFAGELLLDLNATNTLPGVIALVIFALAYVLVVTEEFTLLRKSKPMIIAAGIIWFIVGAIAMQRPDLDDVARHAIEANLVEYVELFLFLLVAMTYVHAMEERNVFRCLKNWLVDKQLSFRSLFWITGWLAFFISPIADNLTTAILMCAVILAVAGNDKKFITLGCINIVVAANAGGAFSPFGDITTLMVWQQDKLPFFNFFKLFLPAVVNFIIPAAFMHFSVPNKLPSSTRETVELKVGAKRIILLFILTLITAVCCHQFLHLPPVIGMTTGLGYISILAYFLKRHEEHQYLFAANELSARDAERKKEFFDIFHHIKQAEWDTLLFFYGVMLAIGGIAALGYLDATANSMYGSWGSALPESFQATPANVVVGVLSAIIDNIPIMYAVLTMDPVMSEGQWLLVTLTAGVGGSLLSVGSAAGVALMGKAPGKYTFFSHLKWSWAIALGYIGSIACHLLINQAAF